MVRSEGVRINGGCGDLLRQTVRDKEIVDPPSCVVLPGVETIAPPAVSPGHIRVPETESVRKTGFQKFSEAVTLLIGETGIAPVAGGILQINLVVGHVQIAADNHGFGLIQKTESFPESLVPFQPVIDSGQFLLGVAAVSVVVFGYFAIHGAVDDFMTVYFYNNLFLYPVETEGSKWELIRNCLKSTLQNNNSYSWLLTAGIFLFLLQLRSHWRDLIMAVTTFAGLTIGTYWGGRGYTYYGLILSVYTIFGLVALVQACRMAMQAPRKAIPLPLTFSALLLAVALLVNYSFQNSSNTYLMKYDREDHPAYRFATTINTVEDAKILNFGFLDGGFYYAAGVDPSCKFFCTFSAYFLSTLSLAYLDQKSVDSLTLELLFYLQKSVVFCDSFRSAQRTCLDLSTVCSYRKICDCRILCFS